MRVNKKDLPKADISSAHEFKIDEFKAFILGNEDWLMEKILFNFSQLITGIVARLMPDKEKIDELDASLKDKAKGIQENLSEESRMLTTIEKVKLCISEVLINTVMPAVLKPFTLLFYLSLGLTGLFCILIVVYLG